MSGEKGVWQHENNCHLPFSFQTDKTISDKWSSSHRYVKLVVVIVFLNDVYKIKNHDVLHMVQYRRCVAGHISVICLWLSYQNIWAEHEDFTTMIKGV